MILSGSRSLEQAAHVAAHVGITNGPVSGGRAGTRNQRVLADHLPEQPDWRDDEEVHDAHEDRRRDPRKNVGKAHPRLLNGPEQARDDEPGHKQRSAQRGEHDRNSCMAAPVREAGENQERDADGEGELPPLGRAQSSWNSLRQSDVSFHSGCAVLSRMNGQSTRLSMCVRMKHWYASAGVHTIGSPRTLNEVLTITAHPVRDSNSLIRS